ncbi:TrbC/VirB2 family protein [Janthinobacterium violaceinigrum]|uniref:Conjugal transfer protein TrbC n=1 Tax=Janthinobacterium violaceinigrum TaxID=2654252 RepID=A0A6I1I318_9BURK|nr:TrbC/VirB2 family protein [Janthinobacterium violaceinigrum]KAB8065262.1 conjugal transfer protein TrbC [Janthinobacterium violaceinigrum]
MKLNKVTVPLLLFILSQPALAGGLEGGKKVLDEVSKWMTSIGLIIVTIALMVVGFRMVFQAAEWKDVAPVFWGGVLIGGASGIAGLFVS